MPKKKGQKEEKEYSLEEALKSSQKTGNDLQNFLSALYKGKGFYQGAKSVEETKPEERIDPQLSYDAESSKKDKKDYVIEKISISEKKSKTAKKQVDISQEAEETKETEELKKEVIYNKLTEFFQKFFEDYDARYNRWEESINALVSVLRKMRKITKHNTQQLISGIKNIYGEIQTNLEQFKIKRDEMEKVSGVDLEEMSREFKKLIGLMSIQLKEYQLRKLTDELLY
jgi:hypothetical protein